MFVLAGCQSIGPGTAGTATIVGPAITAPVERVASAPVPAKRSPSPETDSAETDLWVRIAGELTWQTIENPQVERARARYLAQHDYLQLVSERASLYLYYIVEEVQRRGMPMEIALLPLVESTLDPFAYSSGRAAGLWQIMPATGEHLGLERTWWYDGRRALRDSTDAALDYLETLHGQFDNDWLLALAAYNSGEGRVARARAANAAKGLPTDFWSLKLPRETRKYVPKLIALTQIVATPARYAVTIPPVDNAPAFEIAETGGQIALAKAARLAEVNVDILRELNPGQLRWATAPGQPPELLLPPGSLELFEQAISELPPEERMSWKNYQIQRGDTLGGISKKFSVPVEALRTANNLKGSNIRAGTTLMIPVPGGAPQSANPWSQEPLLADTKVLDYRVRRGDSLYGIAGKFKISIDDIISWNELKSDQYLQPGQQLTLYLSLNDS